MAGRFALVIRDDQLRERVEKLARSIGADPVAFPAPGALDLDESPAAIVVELEMEGAIDAIARWKARWPSCFIAGSLAIPRPDLWHAGIAAGCALVSNRGALDQQLKRTIGERAVGGKGLAIPRLLVRLNERTGDGLAGNLPDAPDGPIIVLRAGGRLCAIFDACPHAQNSLADGKLEGSILTCRAHGSQFDVFTGARVRGPSDFPVRTYRVVEDGDRTYVEL